MAKKKLEITASEEEIEKLKKTLTSGAPLQIALQFAGISQATYFYWVAMYSIVEEAKSQDELELLRANQYGVSIDNIKDIAASACPTKKTSMGAFIEPSAESLLKYRNNKTFRAFANKCYEIVKDCNEARAQAALGHISTIIKSTKDKRVNASGSMWFLERTLSDFFSKPSEKVKEDELNKAPIEKVTVEFVDPNTKENKDRIKEMEELILNEQKDPVVA